MSKLNKYKILYENEKDHNDTLLRIIFKLFDLLDVEDRQEFEPLLKEYSKPAEPFFKPPYKFTCKGDEDFYE